VAKVPTRPVEPFAAPPDIDLELPGSKSITNRALVVAALAPGRSVVHRLLQADDTEAMVEALGQLGVPVAVDAATAVATVDGGAVSAADAASGGTALDVRQSGTTARFLLPVAALADGVTVVDGHPQIRNRPQGHLLDALAHLGVVGEPLDRPGHLPVRIHGGSLVGGSVTLPGNISSQFASGLLMVGPVLAKGLTLELTSEPVSAPYLAMTVAVMRAFGADVTVDDTGRYYTVASTGYRPSGYAIEPDASAASYFFAAAAVSGGRTRVRGLHRSSLQGDVGFVDVLAAMGAVVSDTTAGLEVRGTGPLRGIDTDLRHLSDTAPTLGAIAPFAQGVTRASGIGFIRAKESDRIAAVVTELRRCGITAHEDDDGFVVEPGTPQPAVIQTYEDHRIAMSFAVLGSCAPGIEIADPGCVAKTLPEFWELLDQTRASALPVPQVVAIDGPAGSGKSTIAKALAVRLGVEYLDTGAMYRSIAHAALGAGLDPSDDRAVAALAHGVRIEFGPGGTPVIVDGADATAAIRGPEVTSAVSPVAANPGVRTVLREQQRRWARARGGGVLEGRDIGTVVFPDAALKVYLTAAPEERARRRAVQAGTSMDTELAAMARRDTLDSTRAHSPLTEAADAVVVDTTGLSVEQVVDRIVALLAAARAGEETP
jgi:3-phosphoshikimate 1-carboxyvinyltransferase